MSENNKKILLLVMHQMNIGGAQRVMLNLANSISKKKYKVHLCLFNARGELLDFINQDVIIHDLKSSRMFKGLFKYFSVIRSINPDIILSSISHINLVNSMFSGYIRMISENVRVVCREVNIPSVRSANKENQRLKDFLWRMSINSLDLVIAQSSYMRDDIISFYGAYDDKVEIVPNLLDTDNVLEKSSEALVNYRVLGKVNLLACGRINVQKGFDKLIQIMLNLDDVYHLHLVGDGPERTKIEEMIEKNSLQDRVTLHGYQSNPYPYFAESDLVLVTSIYEGFPNVILEANALGKYVIAFNCPGIDDEIILESQNGSLIESGDIYSFAREVTARGRETVNKDKVMRVVSRHSVIKVISEYDRLFSKLLAS